MKEKNNLKYRQSRRAIMLIAAYATNDWIFGREIKTRDSERKKTSYLHTAWYLLKITILLTLF